MRTVRAVVLIACLAACLGASAQNTRISDVVFVDDLHGWLSVVEPSPALLRTTDGGQSWAAVSDPGSYLISFFDRFTGVAVKGLSESEFAIYRTTDGGEHWEVAATVREEHLHAVAASWISVDDMYLLGEGSGGVGWVGELLGEKTLRVRTDLPVDFSAQSNTLGIFGDGTGHVWILGKQIVLHSADKGKTWVNQYENTIPRIDLGLSGAAVPGGRAWFTAANWDIYRTEDYGQHWVRSLDTADQARINFDDISFYTQNDGCAVGNSSFVYCTRDGGLTWRRSKVFRTYLDGYSGRSRISLFASGKGWVLVGGTLYKTEDGGQTFAEISTNGPVKSSANADSPALERSVNGPTSLAYDRVHGYLYIVEWAQQSLLQLDVKAGTIQTLISRSEDERANDFKFPHSVAVDRNGKVFVGDFTGRIRTFDPASSEWAVFIDEPVRKLDQFAPDAMAVTKSGELLVIADDRILRRGRDGLEPSIGTDRGFSGDGGPANEAALHFPHGLAVAENGDIYIADTENCRIRKVAHQTGTITTIAGNGECGADGDGGPALLAKLQLPDALAIDGQNNLYFIDGNTVRRIDANGIVTTYAGTGEPGFSGDDGLATEAKLNNPAGLAVDEQGNLYISEFVSNRIRRVDARTKTIKTVAGNGEPHRVNIIM